MGSPSGIVTVEGSRLRPGVVLFIECLRDARKAAVDLSDTD